jgi:hypothetical protein
MFVPLCATLCHCCATRPTPSTSNRIDGPCRRPSDVGSHRVRSSHSLSGMGDALRSGPSGYADVARNAPSRETHRTQNQVPARWSTRAHYSDDTDRETRANFDRQGGANRVVVDPRVSFRSAFLKLFRPLSGSTYDPCRHGSRSSFRSSEESPCRIDHLGPWLADMRWFAGGLLSLSCPARLWPSEKETVGNQRPLVSECSELGPDVEVTRQSTS